MRDMSERRGFGGVRLKRFLQAQLGTGRWKQPPPMRIWFFWLCGLALCATVILRAQSLLRERWRTAGGPLERGGWEPVVRVDDLVHGECIGWIESVGGATKGCGYKASNAQAGVCEVLERSTGKRMRAMQGHEGGQVQSKFTCGDCAVDFINFKARVNRALQESEKLEAVTESQPTRGVVMSVHMGVQVAATASVQRLRSTGCTLPVELFCAEGELDMDHPLTHELMAIENVSVQIISDEAFFRYYTKVYAVMHSSFDQVLLLDSDNIVARDPEYLFHTEEFVRDGAIFWPDHWHPDDSPLFHVDNSSMAWELFDVPFTYMYEGESGQLLLDRNRARPVFPILDAYVRNAGIIEKLAVVWGDKDLFRFAYMRKRLPFHMIETPPGLAGYYTLGMLFCGQTLVQHDPSGEIAFFHRNTRKIGALGGWGSHRTWTHVKQFVGKDTRIYRARPNLWWCGACWNLLGRDVAVHDVRTSYALVEAEVLEYARDAAARYRVRSYRHSRNDRQTGS